MSLGDYKIDIEGEGGFIVADGTEFDDGTIYKWNNCTTIAHLHGDFIMELEEILKEHIPNFKIKQEKIRISQLLEGVEESGKPYGRNESAIRIATWLKITGRSREEAWKEILAWNQRNRPPLDIKELERVFENGFDREEPYKYSFAEMNAEYFDADIVENGEKILSSPNILEFII